MGDADGEVMLSVQDIEALMDEGVELIDEGFETLFALVTNLNERTKDILRELKIMESFRRVFVALNIFIVPVVITIILCYGFSLSDNSDGNDFKGGFQSLVMFLMFLSVAVGLPFYILAIWESFQITESENEEPENQSLADESQDSNPPFNDSLLSLPTNESSLERLNEFARMLNDRRPVRMLADLQRRRSAENDSSEQRTLPGTEDSAELEMESATGYCASVEPSEDKQDNYFYGTEEKPQAAEFPILYQFQVLMTEESPDLAVRFEAANNGEMQEATENEETVEQNFRQHTNPQDGAPSSSGKSGEGTDSTVCVSSQATYMQ